MLTCRFPVVLQHFAQHQLVGVQAEGVPEHADGHQEHVTVGALRLRCAGAIEIPLGHICGVGEGQREGWSWKRGISHVGCVRGCWIRPGVGHPGGCGRTGPARSVPHTSAAPLPTQH